jgi:hypothetical protein
MKETKANQKRDNAQANGGIDVTDLLEEKRIQNKRFKVFNKKGQELFGNLCKFSTNDTGKSYKC